MRTKPLFSCLIIIVFLPVLFQISDTPNSRHTVTACINDHKICWRQDTNRLSPPLKMSHGELDRLPCLVLPPPSFPALIVLTGTQSMM